MVIKKVSDIRKPYRDLTYPSSHVSGHQPSPHSSGTHRGHLSGQPVKTRKPNVRKGPGSFNKRLSGTPATQPSPENVIDKKKYGEPQFIQIKKK